MSSAIYEVHGRSAVITMNNPPVNGLGFDLRREIVEGLARAAGDSNVTAVVLTGSQRAFSGGADIREFGTPRSTAEPSLNTVIRVLEGAEKPVVAAIRGACMGGGLELAMACHYRVAVAGAQIALPEVKLGLMPGAGGTQRLPRLIGAEAALNMIVSGEAVLSEKLASSALFDQMIDGDLLQGALAFAARVAEKRPLKRARDIKPGLPNAEGFFQFARNTIGAATRNFPAPLKCVDAVAAAVALPFEEGLRVERELFVQLMQSPESRALRHAFFAERAAAKIPDVPDGWYEARMLTSFVDEVDRVTPSQMDRWCSDFDNWGICDTLCFHLFDRTPHAWSKVERWSSRRDEFVKRAAFALLASLALHDKASGDAPFLASLELVERASKDDRNFVKKGVNWALRSIGRRNDSLRSAAVVLSRRLAESTDAPARWIGKDALRDLTRKR